MSNYFCFINNNININNHRFINIYNINDNKLTIHDENVNTLDYNDDYLVYSKNNILYIMDIKTLTVIKMIHINYTELDYDFVHISDIIIIEDSLIICRVNYLTYYIDRQGLFYKKSAMMTFNLDNLELLYQTDSFNAYNMIASNSSIIGKHLNKIIVFNEKLEILSEINSTKNYNIEKVSGNILLIDEINYISPDSKYIFLLKNNNTSVIIWDINRTILYEQLEINQPNNINNIKITNDYRIIYYTDKINIIKTSLHNNLMNIIMHNLQNYLPIELIDNIIRKID